MLIHLIGLSVFCLLDFPLICRDNTRGVFLQVFSNQGISKPGSIIILVSLSGQACQFFDFNWF